MISFYSKVFPVFILVWSIATQASGQAADTFYYNSAGKSVAKNAAVIYTVVKTEGEVHYTSSYKMDGTLFLTSTYISTGQRHGPLKLYNKDGCTEKEGMYSNGRQVGEWIYYYEGCSNRVYKTVRFENDKAGAFAKYYDSATRYLTYKGMLSNGKLEGKWSFFYKGSKKLESERQFLKGKAHGPAVYYDSTTSVKKTEGQHFNGKREGLWVFYFPGTNKLLTKETYKKGELYGECIRYDSATSRVRTIGSYESGKRVGLWKFYYAGTDKLQSQAEYKNGLYDGQRIVFDSVTGLKTSEILYRGGRIISSKDFYPGKEIIKVEKNFKEGVLNGSFTEFDTVGFKFSILNYRDGKRQGDWKMFFTDVKTKWVHAKFENDVLDGKLETYYADGKKRRVETYDKGKLLIGKCFAQDGTETNYYPFVIEPDYMLDVMNYIANNVRYPLEAETSGIEGEVLVGFVVDEFGKVKNVEVTKGLGNGFDEEAIKVIAGMRTWRPMYLDGLPIASYLQTPVRFSRPGGDDTSLREPMKDQEKDL